MQETTGRERPLMTLKEAMAKAERHDRLWNYKEHGLKKGSEKPQNMDRLRR